MELTSSQSCGFIQAKRYYLWNGFRYWLEWWWTLKRFFGGLFFSFNTYEIVWTSSKKFTNSLLIEFTSSISDVCRMFSDLDQSSNKRIISINNFKKYIFILVALYKHSWTTLLVFLTLPFSKHKPSKYHLWQRNRKNQHPLVSNLVSIPISLHRILHLSGPPRKI